MKKLIVRVIKLLFPKTIRQHEMERDMESIRLQNELNNEHAIRDAVNATFRTELTTKEAIERYEEVRKDSNSYFYGPLMRNLDITFAKYNKIGC